MKLFLTNFVNNIKVTFLAFCDILLKTGGNALKRIFIYGAIISLMLISCSKIIIENSVQNNTIVKEAPKQEKVVIAPKIHEDIKAVTIKNLDALNIETINETNFNMVVLESEGVRRADKNYSTNFTTLKMLNKNAAELERSKIDYFIELTSGPGITESSSISSIFSNNTERMYFAKMLIELADRYNKNEHFIGISIDLKSKNINEDMYYDALTDIISRVRKQYPDLTFIVNLHPLAFENKLENIPKLALENVIVNLPIEIRDFSYPGTSRGIICKFELNKNTVLKALQNLKESDFKTVIVTLDLPWSDKADVFIQDIFEINKMLGFSNNISYGNTNDSRDFSRNDTILKLLKRHNQ